MTEAVMTERAVTETLRVLLVEDSAVDALCARQALSGRARGHFDVTHVTCMRDAVTHLGAPGTDVVLLDLTLPDSEGATTVRRIQEVAPATPIVVMSSRNDDALIDTLLEAGVQDYIVKGRETDDMLQRSVRYALERNRLLQQLEREGRELAEANAMLKQEIGERWKVERVNRELLHDAQERIKELTCLHGVAELLREHEDLGAMFVDIARLMPLAFQHPDVTRVRICFGDTEHVSEGFEESTRKLEGDIVVEGKLCGTLEIHYLGECPDLEQTPFLDEERRLVQTVSGTIAQAVERHRADALLREQSTRLAFANEQLCETQENLEDAVEALQRSNKELDDFAYIVSHDLKEPLRGIRNYSTFLLEDYRDKLNDEGRSKLETLVQLTGHMDDLTNTLLYFSRVGRVDLAVGDIDLNNVLAMVLESLGISLEEHGVEVRKPKELPTARCDGARIGEVFRNLITNAMKYNDKPQKWIEIGFREAHVAREGGEKEEAHGDPIVFYVRDNGIGIREKQVDSVFRMFKRLHGRDKFGGGTGAGLTIAKKIVERHGGRIWVESDYGEGTTFYFTLQSEE